MIIHRIATLASLALPATALTACIDEHHEPAHHAEHHEEHRDPHYTVHEAPARPAPPARPPAGVTGTGHYVWDAVRGQYLWVADP